MLQMGLSQNRVPPQKMVGSFWFSFQQTPKGYPQQHCFLVTKNHIIIAPVLGIAIKHLGGSINVIAFGIVHGRNSELYTTQTSEGWRLPSWMVARCRWLMVDRFGALKFKTRNPGFWGSKPKLQRGSFPDRLSKLSLMGIPRLDPYSMARILILGITQ